MEEKLIDGRRPVAVHGRVGESDMCRVYPALPGAHSSAEADALATRATYDGGLPADADRADLGLPNGVEFVRTLLAE